MDTRIQYNIDWYAGDARRHGTTKQRTGPVSIIWTVLIAGVGKNGNS